MKNLKYKLLVGTSAAVCLTWQLNAQDSVTNETFRHREFSRDHQMPKLNRFEKANKVIGAEVKNNNDQKLGKVKDLAIDLESGRIVEVIVGAGGHLGVGEEIVAVPPSLFMVDTTNKVLRLDSTPDQLKSAPRFELSKWESSVDNASVQAVYQHYGTVNYFDHTATTNFNRPGMGYISRASALLGAEAKNAQGEKVGKVENLVLDLPSGRIAEVIIASGGFLGIGDAYSVVPPGALRYDADYKTIRLDTTKEALMAAPHYRANEMPDVNEPDYVIGVYRSYKVQPYFLTNSADNTAWNVRDRNTNNLTPFDQGNSETDRTITAQIRKQVLATPQLSVNARNVKIITINGRVTLRGPVNSPDEKDRIGEVARQLAPEGNVDNQLEVKVTPLKTGSGN